MGPPGWADAGRDEKSPSRKGGSDGNAAIEGLREVEIDCAVVARV